MTAQGYQSLGRPAGEGSHLDVGRVEVELCEAQHPQLHISTLDPLLKDAHRAQHAACTLTGGCGLQAHIVEELTIPSHLARG